MSTVKVENLLLEKLNKVNQLISNVDSLEYWEDHGDGGFWKPLNDKVLETFGESLHLYDIRISPNKTIRQFHLKDLDDFRKWLKSKGAEIDSEKSREEAIEHAKWLLEEGHYDYFVDEQHGTPYSELSQEAQRKIGYSASSSTKWSPWTVDLLLQKDGWEPDEVYWFSIDRGDGEYCYQLILKEGDWVIKENRFRNCGNRKPIEG